MPHKISALMIVVIIALSYLCLEAEADIYSYMDKRGVWHFTNVKTDVRFSLFLRGGKGTKSYDFKEYIKEFDPIIQQSSRLFNIEVSLIKAIIKVESDFDHQAVSCDGAQGLMQLMPATADDMSVKDPFDPQENILGGTRYLSLLLKRFNNDKILALAAYNAGPERVSEFKGVPPFSETQSFVSKVMKYYRMYSDNSK